jgi:phage terminase large subunit
VSEYNIIAPHSDKQERAIFSERPLVIAATGIQYGKTTIGALRTKIAMHTYTEVDDGFIVAAPNYKIMSQATLPAFLKIMEGFGEYKEAKAEFHMHNGGICYMRTATDPDSVVGITNVRHIWGDEAGKFPLYFHENLQARSSFKEAPICYTTSPYTLNWVYKDYIRKRMKDQTCLPELELIQARSDENPFFPKAEFERKRASMDPRRFNMIYGGQFTKMEGLVYENFSEDLHVCEPRSFDPGTIFIGGVDWGYTAPACILILAVTPNDGVYLVSEFYKSGQTIGQLVEVAQRYKAIYGIERFYADPSSPANIAEFGKGGLTCLEADNDIRPGVDACYEYIQKDQFKVFRGKAPHFIDEISLYHYATEEDIDADKDVKERGPVKQHDHAMDAWRYPMLALKKSHNFRKLVPRVPGTSSADLRSHKSDHILKRKLTDEFDW